MQTRVMDLVSCTLHFTHQDLLYVHVDASYSFGMCIMNDGWTNKQTDGQSSKFMLSL